jgi:hypothetical protein
LPGTMPRKVAVYFAFVMLAVVLLGPLLLERLERRIPARIDAEPAKDAEDAPRWPPSEIDGIE